MEKKFYRTKLLALSILFFLFIAISNTSRAGLYPFSATYSGANEVPPNGSAATGTIIGVYNDVTNTIFYTINFAGLGTPTVAAHFHAPAMPGVNAPVIIGHAGFPLGVMSGSYSKTDVLTDVQEAQLFAGLVYSNIHTTAIPGGEIRAQIILGLASPQIYYFSRTYSGSQEVPPNTSPATGTIVGVYNSMTNTISYVINFSGLGSPTVAAHFHTPAPPGVNAPVTLGHAGFPLGVTSGTYFKSDLLTDAQETNLLAGLFYTNIHTVLLPGGELRTQIFFDAPFVAPTITCPDNIMASTDPGVCTSSVSFGATATGDPSPAITYRIGNNVITSPHNFPVGTTIVRASALNGGGFATCTFTVTVGVINDLTANPDMLWPPNNKMKDVEVNYTTNNNCPGPVTCQLSVTSDEPVGNSSPDWIVVDDHNVRLRAERNGSGDGRVYTITVTCMDQTGNISTSTTTVTVPHDMSGRGFVLNEDDPQRATRVTVLPNPSHNYFTLYIEMRNTGNISVRLIDMSGRIVESRKGISGSQVIRIGENLKAGIYFAEITQGNSTRQLKLVKLE